MKLISYVLIVTAIVSIGMANAQEVNEVYVGEIEGLVTIDGVDYLKANEVITIPIHIRSIGTPECNFAPTMSFVIESLDGAEWGYTTMDYHTEFRDNLFGSYTWTFDFNFSTVSTERFNADGVGGDTIGFAGVFSPGDGGWGTVGISNYDDWGFLHSIYDQEVFLLRIHPTLESSSKTICINYGGERDDGYSWAWSGAQSYESSVDCETDLIIPDFVGAQCFEVLDYQSVCCAYNTGGRTGNSDCDTEGLRNLADITRLIDFVYISHEPLCCMSASNVDGDAQGKVNLSDITRLIDHIYISHNETATCQ